MEIIAVTCMHVYIIWLYDMICMIYAQYNIYIYTDIQVCFEMMKYPSDWRKNNNPKMALL